MSTSSVILDITQYVQVNVGYKSMILQAHRDSVRIVVSELKPATSNIAFHTLSESDNPLHLNILDTNVWVLAVSDKSSLTVTESTTSFATEESLSQLAADINNAISESAFDLNAAAFSETTNITDDYELDSVEFNFTTAEPRTITITTAQGSIILNETLTALDFSWQPPSELAYAGGDNLTVAVTQTGAACSMDCILKVKSGTNTLLGDPHVGWFNTSGTKKGFQDVGDKPAVATSNYESEVSKGNVAGAVPIWGLGENNDIDVFATGEDMWLGPTEIIPHPPTSGTQMQVVSSSILDGVAGTGVLTVRFEYIDGNGAQQTEDLIMNGTTPVNTNAVDIAFVNHFFATSVGSNGVAVGNIDIQSVGGATTYNRIALGGNKSLSCIMRVPSNGTYYLEEWHCSISGGKPTAVRLRSTDWGGVLYNGDDPVFLFKDTAFLGESSFERDFKPPIPVPGGSTIKVSSWATQANAFGSSSFGGYFEADS